MRIAKVLCSTIMFFAVTYTWADEPEEGALFWWEMGVLTSIQSQLAACNELYPVFAQRNNSAYRNSVFANSAYDAALRQYPDNRGNDPHLNSLFDAVEKGKSTIKGLSPQAQNRMCSEFPEKLEETTRSAFGMSSAAIKQRFEDRRRSSGR